MTGCRVLFGSSLVWGSRGREFDSRHSDQRWLSRSAGASNPKGFGAFCFLRLQSRQRLLQTVGDGALAAYVQMAVDICGHLDVRVAQPLLHVFQAVALRQQHAGTGVAEKIQTFGFFQAFFRYFFGVNFSRATFLESIKIRCISMANAF